ncbi:MAG TPA: DUF5666 domain-containing protein [Terriglobia bacterium]|nr:DUF5666 domain-containing protein [Terriglobia bacterium]
MVDLSKGKSAPGSTPVNQEILDAKEVVVINACRCLLALLILGLSIGANRPIRARAGLLVSVPPQASGFTVEGKITERAPGKLTINSEENMLFHILYDDKTEIKQKDGKAGSPADLKVGTKVRVEGDFNDAGAIKARTITLL